MTEIERIKLLIAESEGIELSNWHTANYSQSEAYTRIQADGRKWLASLITTIESQKQAYDELNELASKDALEKNDLIESLKAITELAVKGLKWYADVNNYIADPGMPSKTDFESGDHARTTLSKIERLTNG